MEPCAATGPTEGSNAMDVAFVDDHVRVTCWPAWAEAGEALRATLGDARGGPSCAAAMGFFPLAINASATKQNKTALRSEWKRILSTPCANGALHGAGSPQCPPGFVTGLRNCTTV